MGEPVSVADELKDLAPAGHVYVGRRGVSRDPRGLRVSRARRRTRARSGRDGADVRAALASRSACTARASARSAACSRAWSAAIASSSSCATHLRRLGDGTRRHSSNLIAEAGIGKSRLLAELALSATRSERSHGCEGRSVSTGQQHELPSDRRSLSELARASEEDDDEVAAHAKLDAVVRAVVPRRGGRRRCRSSPRILGLPLEEAWRRSPCGAARRRHGEADAAAASLSSCARGSRLPADRRRDGRSALGRSLLDRAARVAAAPVRGARDRCSSISSVPVRCGPRSAFASRRARATATATPRSSSSRSMPAAARQPA